MCVLAAGEIVGGLSWGRFIDITRDARRTALVVLASQLCALTAAWKTARAVAAHNDDALSIAYCAGALLGFADAGD